MYLTFTFLSLFLTHIVDPLTGCCLAIDCSLYFRFRYYVLIGSIHKSESEHRKSIKARKKNTVQIL